LGITQSAPGRGEIGHEDTKAQRSTKKGIAQSQGEKEKNVEQGRKKELFNTHAHGSIKK
jgi:hypothetical protein